MKKLKDLRVLVTAIGTVNGTSVIDELRRGLGASVYILGANSTPEQYVVNSKFVDEYVVFPTVVDDRLKYLEHVLTFCKKKKITHVFCFIDEEVELFTKNKSKFESIGVKLCLNDYRTVEICHFKNIFSNWIKNNIPNIWIKEYECFNSRTKINFPVFAKPIEGRASIGCKRINNSDEYKSFLKTNNCNDKYILQDFVIGDIVSVDIIRNRRYKQTILIQKKELIRNANGCGIAVEIVDNKELEKVCKLIAKKLDLNGVVNAEFFVSKEGIKIIEINPRLPAGTSYSCYAGGNTVINSLLISEGLPCEFSEIKIGAVYARRYETYEM